MKQRKPKKSKFERPTSNRDTHTQDKIRVNWFPGHMKKTSDLIKKLVDKVDVVVEILDARIPNSSRNPLIYNLTSFLPRLIILNKKDLANPNSTSRWESYFQREKFGVLGLQANQANQKIREKIEEKLSGILSFPPTFTAMICGIPNVGKSTLINLISGEKKTRVGDRPGITRDKQLLRVNGKVPWALVDMPGLLMTKLNEEESFHLSLCGTIKDGIYEEVELASRFLNFFLNSPNTGGVKKLIENFDLPKNTESKGESNHEEIFWLEEIAKRRGHYLRNKVIDYPAAANTVIRDFRNGKLGRITLENP